VTGSVDNLRGAGFQAHFETVGEQVVGRGGLRGCDAKPPGLHVHKFELGQIVFIHQDRRAGEALELERASHMVNVGVGDKNLLELEAKVGEAALNAADLVAGIDDDGLARLLVAQDGAVALEWADWEGLDDHASILGHGQPDALGKDFRVALRSYFEDDSVIKLTTLFCRSVKAAFMKDEIAERILAIAGSSKDVERLAGPRVTRGRQLVNRT